MKFDSIQAFLDMGGYGFYVWLSYGCAFVLLLLLILTSLSGSKNTLKQINAQLKREAKLKQAAELHNKEQHKKELEKSSSEVVNESTS